MPIDIDNTDVSDITIDGQNVSEVTADGQTVFTAIPDSGEYLYVHGNDGNRRFDAVSPFDFSNDSSTQYDTNKFEGIAAVSPRGDTFIVVNGTNILEFSVSTPFDFATKNLENSFAHGESTGQIAVTIHGSSLDNMVTVTRNGDVTTYSLASDFSLSSVTQQSTTSLSGYGAFDGHFNDDGRRFYGSDFGSSVIQFNLASSFDLSGVTSTDSFDTGTGDVGTVMVNRTGDKMYVQHHSPDDLVQYDLTTAFDVTTATNKVTISATEPPDAARHIYTHPAPHY